MNSLIDELQMMKRQLLMDRSSAGRFSSKLIALEWAKIWVEIDKKGKLKEWCTALYYGAKKEFSSKNGPFLKIY